MKNTYYLMRESSVHTIGSCTEPGDLIVVPTEERAKSLRGSLRWYGHRVLRDVVEEDPMVNADQARKMSVEVRTLAEMETMDFNEKIAMEVL